MATIALSLRDKSHSPIGSLIKLALMGLKPWASFFSPEVAKPMYVFTVISESFSSSSSSSSSAVIWVAGTSEPPAGVF
jgi:hypothetical protein